MPVTYYKAPKEVRMLVRKIRRKYHREIHEAKIISLMKSGKWDKMATMGLVSAKQKKAGIDADYILTINDELWQMMDRAQKRALVDHELVHCIIKRSKKGDTFRLRKHDVEEFIEIVKRHGNWELGLQQLFKAMKKHGD